jgi:hypothetical protein
MDTGAVGYNTEVINNQPINNDAHRSMSLRETTINQLFSELTEEIRVDLINYLDRMGLVNESGMLVIPSTRHYFYDAEDLKGVKTIVNLKQLNHVREIRDFLQKISELLPEKSNFVGCFVDNKIQNGFSDKYGNLPLPLSQKAEAYENGIESRIPFINRMYSFIDSRTNRYLTRRLVSRLLEECGLEIVSMNNMNGLTYFCTQKINPAA